MVKATWKATKEPADTVNIPLEMREAYEDARDRAGCINPAKQSQTRLDHGKTNIDRQRHWTSLKDKETSALLLEPDLAKYIPINTLDLVKPDQDIVPTGKYIISKRKEEHGDSPIVTNIYAPSGKLCGTILLV